MSGANWNRVPRIMAPSLHIGGACGSAARDHNAIPRQCPGRFPDGRLCRLQRSQAQGLGERKVRTCQRETVGQTAPGAVQSRQDMRDICRQGNRRRFALPTKYNIGHTAPNRHRGRLCRLRAQRGRPCHTRARRPRRGAAALQGTPPNILQRSFPPKRHRERLSGHEGKARSRATPPSGRAQQSGLPSIAVRFNAPARGPCRRGLQTP